MPEMLEVEYYRRLAERGAGPSHRGGRRAGHVDPQARPHAGGGRRRPRRAHAGRRPAHRQAAATRHRRRPCARRPVRHDRPAFVDGSDVIQQLVYGSARDVSAWDRFALRFADGGDLRLRDPRRLGGIELDPDEGATRRRRPRGPAGRPSPGAGPVDGAAQGPADGPAPPRRSREFAGRRDPVAVVARPGSRPPGRSPKPSSGGCTATCAAPSSSCSRRAARTPATSRTPGCAAASAPETALRCCGARSAAAPPTPAPSTSIDPPPAPTSAEPPFSETIVVAMWS